MFYFWWIYEYIKCVLEVNRARKVENKWSSKMRYHVGNFEDV